MDLQQERGMEDKINVLGLALLNYLQENELEKILFSTLLTRLQPLIIFKNYEITIYVHYEKCVMKILFGKLPRDVNFQSGDSEL